MRNIDIKTLQNEVVKMLEGFGYKPEVNDKGKLIDISFHVNNGFETMPHRQKDAVRMLVKGYLEEFYYGQDTQHVYLYKDFCHGLDPDDERYCGLLHEMCKVYSSEEIPERETFQNCGDYFKRWY